MPLHNPEPDLQEYRLALEPRSATSPYTMLRLEHISAKDDGPCEESTVWTGTIEACLLSDLVDAAGEHHDKHEGTYVKDLQEPAEFSYEDEYGTECEGHESLAGEHMGETVFCDGSCKRTKET
jgi:hypothetical protein